MFGRWPFDPMDYVDHADKWAIIDYNQETAVLAWTIVRAIMHRI